LERKLSFEPRSEPGVGMSKNGYLRIQDRIKREVGGHHASLWLAVAFAFFGVATTLVVTMLSVKLDSAKETGFMVATVASGIVIALCIAMHIVGFSQRKEKAKDICAEMDTYCTKGGRD